MSNQYATQMLYGRIGVDAFAKTCYTATIIYFLWVGFVVSFLMRDREDTLVRRHLNHALIINLIGTVGTFLTRLGGIMALGGNILGIACLAS